MNKRIAEFITDLCNENDRIEKHNESLRETYSFQQETIDGLRKNLKSAKLKIRNLCREIGDAKKETLQAKGLLKKEVAK